MNSNLKISIYIVIGILLFSFSAISAIVNLTEVAIALCLIGVFTISVYIVKKQQQFFSLSIVFWLFSALYGLSTPISLVNGEPMSPVFSFGNLEKNVNPFLIAYSLSNIGFILGYINNSKNNKNQIKEVFVNKVIIKRCVYISAFLASIFELINMLRIGGFSMLLRGKGVYQSLVGDLFITLPSEIMYAICGMFCGIIFGYNQLHKENKMMQIIVYITLLLMPFLACKIILGQRGALISFVLLFLATYTVYCPIKRISAKMVLIFLFIYLFFTFLYTNRSLVNLIATNPSDFFDKAFDLERLYANVNPANNEFGAAFGNFCVFFEKYGIEFDKYYGLTYLQGLLVPIPSFLCFGEKPLQITYAFRDEFFYSWATYSRIASTGFSSILEAYINGGFIGIVIVYAIIGKLIDISDRLRLRCLNVHGLILTSLILPVCMDFSRTAFGGTFGSYVWNSVYSFTIYFLASNMRRL